MTRDDEGQEEVIALSHEETCAAFAGMMQYVADYLVAAPFRDLILYSIHGYNAAGETK